MISAKECQVITADAEEKERLLIEERKAEIRAKTLDFCNTTISERLNQASEKGEHSLVLNFLATNMYNSYRLIYKNGSYWHTDSYIWLDIPTIKEMAEMHGYKVDTGVRSYPKSPKLTEVGKYLTISW